MTLNPILDKKNSLKVALTRNCREHIHQNWYHLPAGNANLCSFISFSSPSSTGWWDFTFAYPAPYFLVSYAQLKICVPLYFCISFPIYPLMAPNRPPLLCTAFVHHILLLPSSSLPYFPLASEFPQRSPSCASSQELNSTTTLLAGQEATEKTSSDCTQWWVDGRTCQSLGSRLGSAAPAGAAPQDSPSSGVTPSNSCTSAFLHTAK